MVLSLSFAYSEKFGDENWRRSGNAFDIDSLALTAGKW
jgi:hypothetical protein